METKYIGGNIVDTKVIERNGVEIGIIEGYIATWDIDRGAWGIKDQFAKGAFLESLKDHKKKDRQIRFKDHHGRTVGGFPIESVKEDERGLFGVAEVNLEVQQGREVHSLARQKVLTDFSIGFTSIDDETDNDGKLRKITKAIIWEGSIVDEPMNTEANITDVKIFFDKGNDLDAAIERIKDYYYETNPEMTRPEVAFYSSSDVKIFDERMLETALKQSGLFSNNAAKIIASWAPKRADIDSGNEMNDSIMAEINMISERLTPNETD